ncbi:MAG: hypothetical protein UEP57_04555 [Oscillospiraceae bacterium]|nr:hypothetical protein [Oscillospiraceae bacterium]
MKKSLVFIFSVAMVFLLCGCCLSHDWVEASCTAPKTCSKCEKTEGEPVGHQWQEATCTTPQTCSTCATTEGKSLGHDWKNATIEAPKTCQRCAATEGNPLWICEACDGTGKKTCTVCNKGIAQCEACEGKKSITCPSCNGNKVIACSSCEGSGNSRSYSTKLCSDCRGTGHLATQCYECRGTKMVPQNGQFVNCTKCGGVGSLPITCWTCGGKCHLKYYEKCSECNGRGNIRDENCKGSGKITCEICTGKGNITCNTCNGTLIATCETCNGNGWTTDIVSSGVKIDFIGFTVSRDDPLKIDNSFPRDCDYVCYTYYVDGPNNTKTYTLRERRQLPGEEAKLAGWTTENVKVGEYRGSVWDEGYSALNSGILVVEILIDKTGEVVGRFEMPIE